MAGRDAGTAGVAFPGEIDLANADSVGAELTAAFGPGAGLVIADMSGARSCDTSGIHALMMAYK
jgi:anti-anti-sigma regulatory factor